MKLSTSFKTLQQFFLLQLARRLVKVFAQNLFLTIKIERRKHVADGLSANPGDEIRIAMLVLSVKILLFRQHLPLLERRGTRIDDDILLEIEHTLQIAQRQVEHQTDTARKRFQEPDMRDRRSELDMAHALAADLLQRHLDAAFLADNALELHALVLAAQAFIVLHRPEDAAAEQAVALGLEGSVVNRLRLFDLTVGPRQDPLGRCERDANLIKCLSRLRLLEDVVGDLIHGVAAPKSSRANGE